MLLYHLARLYALLGALVAAGFVLRGIDRAMPAARGAYAFRPLLLPGLVLLWPLVLWRWWRLAQPAPPPPSLGRHYQETHLTVWLALIVLLPLLLLLAIALRQDPAADPAPQRLAAPAVSAPAVSAPAVSAPVVSAPAASAPGSAP